MLWHRIRSQPRRSAHTTNNICSCQIRVQRVPPINARHIRRHDSRHWQRADAVCAPACSMGAGAGWLAVRAALLLPISYTRALGVGEGGRGAQLLRQLWRPAAHICRRAVRWASRCVDSASCERACGYVPTRLVAHVLDGWLQAADRTGRRMRPGVGQSETRCWRRVPYAPGARDDASNHRMPLWPCRGTNTSSPSGAAAEYGLTVGGPALPLLADLRQGVRTCGVAGACRLARFGLANPEQKGGGRRRQRRRRKRAADASTLCDHDLAFLARATRLLWRAEPRPASGDIESGSAARHDHFDAVVHAISTKLRARLASEGKPEPCDAHGAIAVGCVFVGYAAGITAAHCAPAALWFFDVP
mmetsp:Transcript_14946/g.34212  ORF Transcript_14946/g.34212 Transcript_14946/m.34212 type:complete len:360 (-) Transcript_14946:168-1247(-)